MSTCDRLDLQTLGSQPIMMPKKIPRTLFLTIYGRGEPAVGYGCTGWVWETIANCWSSSRLEDKLLIILEEFIEEYKS